MEWLIEKIGQATFIYFMVVLPLFGFTLLFALVARGVFVFIK
jgi:hypothetical protein